MNKISFTIPKVKLNEIPNENKIEDNNPLELTNVKPNTKIPSKINNITNYTKIAPNVYIFCNNN